MSSSDSSVTARLVRQFELTDADFTLLCRLAREHTGIALAENKRELVYGRIGRRLRKLQLASFREYCELLEQAPATELEHFINAVTTNLTSFFREQHHFAHLAQEALPHLLHANSASRRLRIWSAGCATGEEAYSIAMVVRETLGTRRGWDVRVLATDVDSNVLATAQAGIYARERLEMSEERRQRWFDSVPDRPGHARVRPEVAQLVTFRPLNLMARWPMRGPFDVVFCRNVVIYFDKPTQRELFERIALLQPAGALLYVGHSESLFRITDRYELIGKTAWRRVAP